MTLVGPAIVIRVFEQPDAPGGRRIERIARHLGYEPPPALVDLHRDRRRNVGLRRDELDSEAGLEAEVPDRVGRRVRRARGRRLDDRRSG